MYRTDKYKGSIGGTNDEKHNLDIHPPHPPVAKAPFDHMFNTTSSWTAEEKLSTSVFAPLSRYHAFQVAGFISSCRHLLPVIRQGWREQGNNHQLPIKVQDYLSTHLRMNTAEVRQCWELLLDEIMRESEHPLQNIMPAPHSTRESINTLTSLDLRECPNSDEDHFTKYHM